jgi:hypothetical protein
MPSTSPDLAQVSAHLQPCGASPFVSAKEQACQVARILMQITPHVTQKRADRQDA